MIDYSERIEDVLEFVSKEMGVVDRQAVCICLATRLPAHPRSEFPPAWVALETQMIRPGLSWFSFGQDCDPIIRETSRLVYLDRLKETRPRYANPPIKQLMEEWRESPRLFVDTSYSLNLRPVGRHAYHKLNACLLRVRSDVPHAHLPPHTAVTELGRLARLVWNLEHRSETLFPRQWKPSAQMMDLMRMVSYLNPDLRYWDHVYQNVSMLVSSHACLFGREKPDQIDILAAARVLKDSIRWRELKMLDPILSGSGWLHAAKIRDRTGMDYAEIQKVGNWLVQKKALNRKGKLYSVNNKRLDSLINGSMLDLI